jgi:hypothetical protein
MKCVVCGQKIPYGTNKGATRHECPQAVEAGRKRAARQQDGFTPRPPTFIERLHLGYAMLDDVGGSVDLR